MPTKPTTATCRLICIVIVSAVLAPAAIANEGLYFFSYSSWIASHVSTESYVGLYGMPTGGIYAIRAAGGVDFIRGNYWDGIEFQARITDREYKSVVGWDLEDALYALQPDGTLDFIGGNYQLGWEEPVQVNQTKYSYIGGMMGHSGTMHWVPAIRTDGALEILEPVFDWPNNPQGYLYTDVELISSDEYTSATIVEFYIMATRADGGIEKFTYNGGVTEQTIFGSHTYTKVMHDDWHPVVYGLREDGQLDIFSFHDGNNPVSVPVELQLTTSTYTDIFHTGMGGDGHGVLAIRSDGAVEHIYYYPTGDYSKVELISAERHIAVTAFALIRAIKGDINGDGQVDMSDLNMVLIDWGKSAGEIADPFVDTNKDGIVDITDLNAVLIDWGK